MKPNTTEYFYTVKKGGLKSQCIDCHAKYQKEYKLMKYYSLTLEEHTQMIIDQDEKCLICEEKLKLYVDHCHTTKKVRGLLCDLCNRGIGLLKENVNTLKRAIDYIEKNK